jgi:DNA-binding MarR family transcriptional regulator
VRVLARLCRLLESTDSGLSLPQYRMLVRLSAGGERSARLADALRVRKPTVTALADGLVAAGLAARIRDPDDRRVVRLALTDAGRAALAKADRAYADRLAPVLAELTDPDRFVTDLIEIEEVLDARLR